MHGAVVRGLSSWLIGELHYREAWIINVCETRKERKSKKEGEVSRTDSYENWTLLLIVNDISAC